MASTKEGHAGLLVKLDGLEDWRPRPFFRNGLFSEVGRIGPRWVLAIRGQNAPAPAIIMPEPTPEEYETGEHIVEGGP